MCILLCQLNDVFAEPVSAISWSHGGSCMLIVGRKLEVLACCDKEESWYSAWSSGDFASLHCMRENEQCISSTLSMDATVVATHFANRRKEVQLWSTQLQGSASVSLKHAFDVVDMYWRPQLHTSSSQYLLLTAPKDGSIFMWCGRDRGGSSVQRLEFEVGAVVSASWQSPERTELLAAGVLDQINESSCGRVSWLNVLQGTSALSCMKEQHLEKYSPPSPLATFDVSLYHVAQPLFVSYLSWHLSGPPGWFIEVGPFGICKVLPLLDLFLLLPVLTCLFTPQLWRVEDPPPGEAAASVTVTLHSSFMVGGVCFQLFASLTGFLSNFPHISTGLHRWTFQFSQYFMYVTPTSSAFFFHKGLT